MKRWLVVPLALVLFSDTAHAASLTSTAARTIGASMAQGMGAVTSETIDVGPQSSRDTYQGTFVDYAAHRPCGYGAPTGHTLTLTIDNEAKRVVEVGLTGNPGLTASEPCRQLGAIGSPGATEASSPYASSARRRPTARVARWGHESCSSATHCYGIAQWGMTGSEQVEGQACWQRTEAMYIYDLGPGSFVDHECWTGFEPQYYWVEAGQEGASNWNCCALHPFWAKRNHYGYLAYEAPWTVEGFQENESIMESLLNGNWRITWCFPGKSCEAKTTVSSLPYYSNYVSGGAEIATNIDPDELGNDQSVVKHLNGKWYTWNKETATLREHQCVERNFWHVYAGDLRFYTHANYSPCPE